jgi:hypothetical protein
MWYVSFTVYITFVENYKNVAGKINHLRTEVCFYYQNQKKVGGRKYIEVKDVLYMVTTVHLPYCMYTQMWHEAQLFVLYPVIVARSDLTEISSFSFQGPPPRLV